MKCHRRRRSFLWIIRSSPTRCKKLVRKTLTNFLRCSCWSSYQPLIAAYLLKGNSIKVINNGQEHLQFLVLTNICQHSTTTSSYEWGQLVLPSDEVSWLLARMSLPGEISKYHYVICLTTANATHWEDIGLDQHCIFAQNNKYSWVIKDSFHLCGCTTYTVSMPVSGPTSSTTGWFHVTPQLLVPPWSTLRQQWFPPLWLICLQHSFSLSMHYCNTDAWHCYHDSKSTWWLNWQPHLVLFIAPSNIGYPLQRILPMFCGQVVIWSFKSIFCTWSTQSSSLHQLEF